MKICARKRGICAVQDCAIFVRLGQLPIWVGSWDFVGLAGIGGKSGAVSPGLGQDRRVIRRHMAELVRVLDGLRVVPQKMWEIVGKIFQRDICLYVVLDWFSASNCGQISCLRINFYCCSFPNLTFLGKNLIDFHEFPWHPLFIR